MGECAFWTNGNPQPGSDTFPTRRAPALEVAQLSTGKHNVTTCFLQLCACELNSWSNSANVRWNKKQQETRGGGERSHNACGRPGRADRLIQQKAQEYKVKVTGSFSKNDCRSYAPDRVDLWLLCTKSNGMFRVLPKHIIWPAKTKIQSLMAPTKSHLVHDRSLEKDRMNLSDVQRSVLINLFLMCSSWLYSCKSWTPYLADTNNVSSVFSFGQINCIDEPQLPVVKVVRQRYRILFFTTHCLNKMDLFLTTGDQIGD